MTIALANPLAGALRRSIVQRVRATFNDQSRGERPVERRSDGLFRPGSPIWRVHGDVTSMMIGGVAALLLQMLHPAVLAGVWDHSNFRADMHGRLRRTARFIALTTYGSEGEALAAIDRVRAIHDRIGGTLPDGTRYAASDPHLLAWVHVSEAWSFLAAWQRYGARPLDEAEQDVYYADFASIAERLGADPVPRSRAEAATLIAALRPELAVDDRTREVARIVLEQRPARLAERPLQALTFQAAVDLLPDWARRMHGLRGSALARPLVDLGATGFARTLRWAFAGV